MRNENEELITQNNKLRYLVDVQTPELMARILGKITHFEELYERQQKLPPADEIGVRRGAADSMRRSYLDLLEQCLTGIIYRDKPMSPWSSDYDPEVRELGRDWPASALTMIGLRRMRNIRILLERVILEGVKGDFVETGVWRGGACIYARGIFAAHNIKDRAVWVADSFNGLPPPSPEQYPADDGDVHHTYEQLRVSRSEVAQNFAAYQLLDDQVRFLEGWFSETLPAAPIEQIAVLRLDGDMYESTIQALEYLYPKLSSGGYVIIDDFGLRPCRKAVDDYRARHNIVEKVIDIDGAAVYWKKTTGDDARQSNKVASGVAEPSVARLGDE